MGVSVERMFALGGNVTIHISSGFEGSAYVVERKEILAEHLENFLRKSSLRGCFQFFCCEITHIRVMEVAGGVIEEETADGRIVVIDIGKVRVRGCLVEIRTVPRPPRNTHPIGITVTEMERTPEMMHPFLLDVANSTRGDGSIDVRTLARIGMSHFKLSGRTGRQAWWSRLERLVMHGWLTLQGGKGRNRRYALGPHGMVILRHIAPAR